PCLSGEGGQHTHTGRCTVFATALGGNGDLAFELYQMINPLPHSVTAEDVSRYKVEPYVVAPDVDTATGHLGRGGWTWYTGSASWMYRVGLEAILGFRKSGRELTIRPCTPAAWPRYTISFRYGRREYDIVVHDPGAVRGDDLGVG